jgi:hypothetical protein
MHRSWPGWKDKKIAKILDIPVEDVTKHREEVDQEFRDMWLEMRNQA